MYGVSECQGGAVDPREQRCTLRQCGTSSQIGRRSGPLSDHTLQWYETNISSYSIGKIISHVCVGHKDNTCGYQLQSNISVARICSNGYTHANITFFSTASSSANADAGTRRQLLEATQGGAVKSYGEVAGRCENVPLTLQTSYPE